MVGTGNELSHGTTGGFLHRNSLRLSSGLKAASHLSTGLKGWIENDLEVQP